MKQIKFEFDCQLRLQWVKISAQRLEEEERNVVALFFFTGGENRIKMYGSPEGGQRRGLGMLFISRESSLQGNGESTQKMSSFRGSAERKTARQFDAKEEKETNRRFYFSRKRTTNQIEMKWHSFSGKRLIGQVVLASLVELFMNFRFAE